MSRKHFVAPLAIALTLIASRCQAITPDTSVPAESLGASDAIVWSTLPVIEKAFYDYDRAMKLIETDRVTIFLNMDESAILPYGLSIDIEGQKLESSGTTETWHTVPRLVDGKWEVVIDGLDPATVYRFRLCLVQGGQQLGKLPYWYFASTTSSDPVEHARGEIIMSAFREWNAFNYRHVGPSRYGGGAWCSNFYRFAAASRLEDLGAPGTWGGNGLDWHFRKAGAITSSSELSAVGRHGDYIRLPGHTAMLIAYDKDAEIIWTIEGNWSNSIRIKQRRLYTGWTLGRITENQLCDECRLLPIN